MAYEIDLDKVPIPRPFKITDEANSVKKSLMVSTLWELKMQAKLKLNINAEKDVKVLENDDTELDEEDVFQSLQKGSLLTVCIANPDGEKSGKILPPPYEEVKKDQNTVSSTEFKKTRTT